MGQCPGCAAWNTLTEETRGREKPAAKRAAAGRPLRLHEVEAPSYARLKTEISELDRILGGGLVPGLAGPDRRLARHRQVDADDMALGNLEGAGRQDALRLR